jgi:hypothetical protein
MFVPNQWYVASWDHEIDREPLARVICGETIMLYRKFDRTVVAIHDACPHRLLPLSMGVKEGDNIRCRNADQLRANTQKHMRKDVPNGRAAPFCLNMDWRGRQGRSSPYPRFLAVPAFGVDF